MNQIPFDDLLDVVEIDDALTQLITDNREKADPHKMMMILICKAVQIAMIHDAGTMDLRRFLHMSLESAMDICRRGYEGLRE